MAVSKPCSRPCARRSTCLPSSSVRFSGAPAMMRSPTMKCGVPWMPILVASWRVSSISFFTSGEAMSFLSRAMSRPSFSAMRSAEASLAWPWLSSMARWNSQYLPCILAASATREASSEPLARIGNSFRITRTFLSLSISWRQLGERLLAVAAVVIEELDHRHVALGVADDGRAGGADTARVACSLMATAMRSAWILSILDSSAFCTSSMISGLLSRMSLMMRLELLALGRRERAGRGRGGLCRGGLGGGGAGASMSEGVEVCPMASVAPASRIAGTSSSRSFQGGEASMIEADGLAGMGIPSVADLRSRLRWALRLGSCR